MDRSGDTVVNLRVRTSDPLKKCVPKKFLKLYFGLKHPKMTIVPLFPRSAFLFLKNALLFSRIALFPELLSFYLLCASFSKNAVFPADCTFSSSCSERWYFPCFFCCLLELFIDQLDNCTTSTRNMIFYAFYVNGRMAEISPPQGSVTRPSSCIMHCLQQCKSKVPLN